MQVAGSGIFDTASAYYDSPTIVNLNGSYDASSRHDIYWDSGPSETDYTETSITIPGIPNVSLLQIDDTNPYSVALTYYADSEMYSSTLAIGDQFSFSAEPREPRFSGFNQTVFPGPLDPGGPNTPIVFHGRLAGHDFGGQSCYVSKSTNLSRSDFKNSMLTEVKGDQDVVIEVTHVGSENFNTYSYCTQPVPGSGAVQVNHAGGSIDTHNNICVFVVDCDIWLIAEVNNYPTDTVSCPPPGSDGTLH